MTKFIYPYRGIMPKIHETAFIAPSASIIGDVEIGEGTNIWYNCVLRGDVYNIKIGKSTNIQDGTVIHTTSDFQGTYIGDGVTVGHSAILHACTVEDYGFVGMQACVMDGAVVEGMAMLAAGALLTPGKRVPRGQLWAGRPAKFMREMMEEENRYILWSAEHYRKLGQEHKENCCL
ncbi:MAG: gamma carbonic anhydrase family protein [Alphaproteobacteria bacterium]|nr:gamma carbonic anhydrase family protein [Alphaproteobacteria bacterium]MBP7757832.1 gamma carbonic anhydrase family protein [Alphaproteobacteria bacterium]MBP7760968.1 gamma carbonic anhydrase family protein [Alphaproteobacteria bacterium]MBP7905258.1 gamma carbonic anhydrase family protein [Alphaproteobacteria bacterium]